MRTRTAPLRVAIVGSGPSGLYAAVDLLKRDASARVEMFDRLPTLGGLVRSGVSPDHAARRQVCATYERIALSSGRFRFHGNVEIGHHLTHVELLAHHHAVIYASGAASGRRLDIPGEALPGSHAATEFVGWYNGHPDFSQRCFDLSCERAVVIGNGNVAIDVARMLLLPAETLQMTDIADHALAALRQCAVREVIILGRRGVAQTAFTSPELLELERLHDVDIVVDYGTAYQPIEAGDSLRVRLIDEYARRGVLGRGKRLVLRFLASPVEILGSDRVEGVRIVRNSLVRSPDGTPRAQASTQFETIPAGLVLRSVGYRALPVSGLPFDESAGVLPNRFGRVINPATLQPLSGVYVAGWLKRGPSGVIGTNKQCSQETVKQLLEDASAGLLPVPSPAIVDALDTLLIARQPNLVDYGGWRRIDRQERSIGAVQGRPRVKLSSHEALLLAAR